MGSGAMADALNWVFEGARYELVIKALTLVLLVGLAVALWELIRYLRTLRLERDLARRLTMQQVYGSAHDPRYAAEPARSARRSGLLSRLVRGTVQTVGLLTILILAGAAAAMPFLGTWLERQDYLEKADYIVPLPGDDLRLVKAAELYKQGFAPRVLVAGAAPSSPDAPLAVLEKAGVPRASTVRLSLQPLTVAGTAEAVKTFADGRRMKVIVVAPAIKSLRTKVVFEDAAPRARFIVVAPPDGTIERPWWNSSGTRRCGPSGRRRGWRATGWSPICARSSPSRKPRRRTLRRPASRKSQLKVPARERKAAANNPARCFESISATCARSSPADWSS